MGIRLLGIAMLVACSAIAQSPATGTSGGQTPALQTELKKLAADAELLHSDLPGFACTETGVSEAIKEDERNPNKNKVKAQVQFVASVRAERAEEGRLHESLTLSEVNGKPSKPVCSPMCAIHRLGSHGQRALSQQRRCFNADAFLRWGCRTTLIVLWLPLMPRSVRNSAAAAGVKHCQNRHGTHCFRWQCYYPYNARRRQSQNDPPR